MDENRELQENNREARRIRRRYYRPSFIWPLILIALGLIFLLKNMGSLTGNTWDLILRAWPVLLIAIGVDDLIRRENVVGPIFWIGLGVIFLLSNFNLLAISVWDVILRLWPLIFVAIGLDILVRRKSILVTALGVILIIALMVGALSFLGVGTAGAQVPGEQVSQALNGATKATLTLEPAVGSIQVSSGAGSSNLLDGSVREGQGSSVRQDYSVSSGSGNFSMRNEGVSGIYPVGSPRKWDWDLRLNSQMPVDLRVNMGAGLINLDLSSIKIDNLTVSMGLGSTTVTLPQNSSLTGKVDGAMGELVVIVPRGVGARIRSSGGIAVTRAPEDFQKQENVYTSPDYNTAANKIDLELNQAIGWVNIKYP